jgi:hypothetical protein
MHGYFVTFFIPFPVRASNSPNVCNEYTYSSLRRLAIHTWSRIYSSMLLYAHIQVSMFRYRSCKIILVLLFQVNLPEPYISGAEFGNTTYLLMVVLLK